ncbi:permease prefix domain 1-containing protein [Nonomuraea sp. ZG12]|uniref:permease prefix domain 1-containing protein n=1 Tax=Nonomuraea sp. ZG12 TaxID=3452207 RepID=UPI003F8BE5BD
MTATLTDRYVMAMLRGVPGKQRADLERELRASIADAIDDRLRDGADPESAETQVIAELGDPARLAARYTGRPQHLIGPELYLDYVRLLKALLSAVVPVLFVAAGLVRFLDGAPIGQVVWDAVVAVLVTAMHITFWVTAVFAVIGRSPALREKLRVKWDVSALPALPAHRVDLTGLIGGAVVTTLLACLLVLTQTVGPLTGADGEPIGVIAPALWESGALYLAVFFAAARIGFDLLGYYVGWGVPQAVANAVLGVLFSVTVVWLAAGDLLLNHAFLAALGWSRSVVTYVVVITVVLMSLTDSADGFRRAFHRHPRISQ